MRFSPLALFAFALPCIVAVPASHADLNSLHLVDRGVLEERQSQRTTTTTSRKTTTTTTRSTTTSATTTSRSTTTGRTTTTTTTTTSHSTTTSPSSSSSTTSQSSLFLSSSVTSAVATTTSSTNTATTSTVAIVTPSPLVCGVSGYSGAINSYNYGSNINNETFAGCRDHCLAYGPCVSFAVLPGTFGACALFNVSAYSNLTPAPTSSWLFYDAACAAESPIINPYPTTTTTTTTTTTKTIPTTSPLCGVVGYNGPINAYFQYVDDGPTPYADCSGECAYDVKCLSFAQNPSDTNHCYLYNITVEDNVVPVAGSPYTFYDVWCPPPATTTTTISTSSTTTSPSATTTTAP